LQRLGLIRLQRLGLIRLQRLGLSRLQRLGLIRLQRLGLIRLQRLGLIRLQRLGLSRLQRLGLIRLQRLGLIRLQRLGLSRLQRQRAHPVGWRHTPLPLQLFGHRGAVSTHSTGYSEYSFAPGRLKAHAVAVAVVRAQPLRAVRARVPAQYSSAWSTP
jgi:hypothetical protein